MTTTWRDVAERLAARMRHHAYCADHDRQNADPKNCPFCDDRAAYDEYLRKLAAAR